MREILSGQQIKNKTMSEDMVVISLHNGHSALEKLLKASRGENKMHTENSGTQNCDMLRCKCSRRNCCISETIHCYLLEGENSTIG